MDGVTTIVKVAHVRKLCHSRSDVVVRRSIRARRRRWCSTPTSGRSLSSKAPAQARRLHDNMKTAAETIFLGKDRQYNRRFLQMCSHHLVEPVACTPASGCGEGARSRTRSASSANASSPPRLRSKSYDELNAWLLDKCLSWAKAHAHPERPDQTIWEVFEEERLEAHSVSRPFRWVPRAATASVSKTCLVRFDNNKCSVSERRPGRPRRHPRLRRSDRCPPGWTHGGRSTRGPAATAAAKRSTIPGITCRFWRASRALCAMERRLQGLGKLPAALDRVQACGFAGSHDGDRQMVKNPRRGAHRRIACG